MREMMKNKKKTVILAVAVILMIGICTACMLWMRTPGIHFLFGFVHADLKEKCYLYNPKEDKFLGQTEVVIKGNGNGITKKFDGEVSVVGYELEGEPVDSILMQEENSIWNMQYVCVTGSMKENSEGVKSWTPEVNPNCYVVNVDTKNSGDFSIAIAGMEEPLYVVHAVSEEKAREVFQTVVIQGRENVVWD